MALAGERSEPSGSASVTTMHALFEAKVECKMTPADEVSAEPSGAGGEKERALRLGVRDRHAIMSCTYCRAHVKMLCIFYCDRQPGAPFPHPSNEAITSTRKMTPAGADFVPMRHIDVESCYRNISGSRSSGSANRCSGGVSTSHCCS